MALATGEIFNLKRCTYVKSLAYKDLDRKLNVTGLNDENWNLLML